MQVAAMRIRCYVLCSARDVEVASGVALIQRTPSVRPHYSYVSRSFTLSSLDACLHNPKAKARPMDSVPYCFIFARVQGHEDNGLPLQLAEL